MRRWMGLLLLAAGHAHAAWFGALGKAADRDEHSLEFFYTTGARDLKEDATDKEQKMSLHRLTLQYERGLGQGFELVARATPFTSRVNFDGSSLNPDVWNVGGGLHWAPPESLGPLRVGILFSVDYFEGRETRDDAFNWLDYGAAAGATYPLPFDVNASAGVSMIKSEARSKVNGRVTEYSMAGETGGFVGAGWTPNAAWNVVTEVHFGNERVWGMSARYNFQ